MNSPSSAVRNMVTRTLLVAALAPLVWPSPADAQIYAWRDAGGNLVLSDRLLDEGATTYEVPQAPSIRATPPVASSDVDNYEPLVQEHAARQSLRPDLVRAVIQVESGFNPWARSPKGAMGLMQLMPGTARELGVRNAYDPEENIRGGMKHMRNLLDMFDNDLVLSLAAYNAGENVVQRTGRVPGYRETRDYVRSITRRYGSKHVAPASETPPAPQPMFRYMDRDGVLHLTNIPPVQGSQSSGADGSPGQSP